MKKEHEPVFNPMKPIKPRCFILLVLALLLFSIIALFQTIPDNSPNRPASFSSFNPPLRFEKNLGQTTRDVDFLCRGRNHILLLNSTGSSLHVLENCRNGNSAPLCMELDGANPEAQAVGYDESQSRSNYYIGSDPGRWLVDVPHYTRVVYDDIYAGIDMVYYSRDQNVEFDFMVAPGADPQQIRLVFSGADRFEKDKEGNLSVHAGGHQLVYHKPSAWQDFGERKQDVEVQFALLEDQSVQFDVGSYDQHRMLTIDPQIVYATYLGGSDIDAGSGIAVDNSGCAYVTGSTISTNFPTEKAFQNKLTPGMFSNLSDVFVTKMNPEGTNILYSTYLGGRWDDSGAAIAVDGHGRACLTGRTSSNDDANTSEYEGFPLEKAFQTKIGDPNKSDAFVTVLDSLGRLYYSTYLGGTYEDYGTDIAVDASGCVYITGSEFSYDFPVKNAYLSQKPGYYFDAFVTKIDPAKSGVSSLVYSTHLGGKADSYGNSIAVDSNGRAYVTGKTSAADFPTSTEAIQSVYQGKGDIFVTKFDPTKSGKESLIYSTFLGNNASNEGLSIAVDDYFCAIVSGYGPVPTTPGSFTTGSSAFICKLNMPGNGFVFSASPRSARKLATDAEGNIYASSTSLRPGVGAGVMALNADGSDTLFTHQLIVPPSDVAVGSDGYVYLTGSTDSPDFPTKNAYLAQPAGKTDAFVVKLQPADVLAVKVYADPVFWQQNPVRNTPVDIYAIDLANRSAPLTYIEHRSTDHKGVLRLPIGSTYQPGMPILISAMPERKISPKNNRTDNTRFMHKVHVDNLNIDQNGRVSAQLLETNPEDTTRTFLHHTSIGFSLVVSVEWLASPEYITNLESAFRKASNMLYDVTNGQAFIDSVAIFDNYDHWDQADIRIHAENTKWPSANLYGIKEAEGFHVFLPPAFYCNYSKILQIQSIYDDDPIVPSIPMTVTTIVHELGHYALGFRDEYENILGEQICPNINFGFMDRADELNNPMSTEMSDYRQNDQRYDDYRLTEHFQFRNSNCWDYFKLNYDNIYGDLVASIHRPRDAGIYPNAVIEGPNSNWNDPDFSVGDLMGFEIKATMTTKPRLDYRFTNANQPVPGAQVSLTKFGTFRQINHGKTTAVGRMKLFNAEAGDIIFATHQDDHNWLFIEHLLNTALAKSNDATATIEMKTMNGRFTLISDLAFDAAGELMYRCQSDPAFTAPPSIRLYDDTSASDRQPLSASGGSYAAVINKPGFSEGSVIFSAPDSLGEDFLVRQEATVKNRADLAEVGSFGNIPMELSINRSKTTAKTIAALASGFPVPKKGLPDSLRRVSDAVALNSYPNGSVLKGQIQIQYHADSLEAMVPDAVKLYKWENGWIPLSTGVNLTRATAATDLDGPGIFAVFLDLTRSKVTSAFRGKDTQSPTGWMLYPNYPNPFNSSTCMRYSVPRRSHLKIEIYNLLGRKIRTLADHLHEAGVHSALWDGLDDHAQTVSSGIYICRIQSAEFTRCQKMSLIR